MCACACICLFFFFLFGSFRFIDIARHPICRRAWNYPSRPAFYIHARNSLTLKKKRFIYQKKKTISLSLSRNVYTHTHTRTLRLNKKRFEKYFLNALSLSHARNQKYFSPLIYRTHFLSQRVNCVTICTYIYIRAFVEKIKIIKKKKHYTVRESLKKYCFIFVPYIYF